MKKYNLFLVYTKDKYKNDQKEIKVSYALEFIDKF